MVRRIEGYADLDVHEQEAEMTYEVKDVQFLASSLVLITESFQLVTFNG